MLNLKVVGISEILDKVSAAYTEAKLKELVERLMKEGYEIASAGFADALYAGKNDVKVLTPRWEGNAMVLEATGKSVAFIEFGAGVRYEEYPDQSAYENAGLAQRGQFEKKHGSNPPWFYEGDPGNFGRMKRNRDGTPNNRWVITWGNTPARAMYDASKVFDSDHVLEVAREVFK